MKSYRSTAALTGAELIERNDLAKDSNWKYVLISPCRDEEKYMRETLRFGHQPIDSTHQMDHCRRRINR